jgi:dodecin
MRRIAIWGARPLRGPVSPMARSSPRMRKMAPEQQTRERSRSSPREAMGGNGGHEHRTAKVVELIGTSRRGFDEAIQNAIEDASATTRGITGAHVVNMSVKCDQGRILEYKVNLRVAFGIERTEAP